MPRKVKCGESDVYEPFLTHKHSPSPRSQNITDMSQPLTPKAAPHAKPKTNIDQ